MKKIKKVLIMGLPGSGKTTLAKKLVKALKAKWLNADKIRGKYNDWNFSKAGVIRQVKRMKSLASKSKKNTLLLILFVLYQNNLKFLSQILLFGWIQLKKADMKI